MPFELSQQGGQSRDGQTATWWARELQRKRREPKV